MYECGTKPVLLRTLPNFKLDLKIGDVKILDHSDVLGVDFL